LGKQRLLSKIAFCASIFAFCVIALGALTRLIDAGLGCPDWPGCYGHMVLPMSETAKQSIQIQYPASHYVNYKAWAEMIHRYFVGGLSCFILAIIMCVFIIKRNRTTGNMVAAVGLLLLLGYQIMLGQWTVTLKLLPIIVSQHLLGGFFILSVLWFIYLNNREQQQWVVPGNIGKKGLLLGAIIGLGILMLQICLGAWTSTNYASLSCPDFPFCVNDNPLLTMYFKEAFNLISPIGMNYEGGVLPEMVRQTIQISHRMGALILAVYLFIFMSIAMTRLKLYPHLLKIIYLIFGLLLLQISIGITNVLFKLPLVTAISHNIVAAMLLLSMITFIYFLAILQKRL
jgi:cytochrome c oxidase assembly protein subunit 15